MSRISFENYAKRAKQLSNDTEKAGRYTFQGKAERYILSDIVKKLNIDVDDNILDIGSGTGNITIPLSFICREVYALDHPDVLDALKNRCGGLNNFTFLSGNFLDLDVDRKFNKILVYSVLHCLKDEKEVKYFIDKALSLLEIGGRLLLGDIPNASTKKRFIESDYGKIFLDNWKENMNDSLLRIQPLELDEDNMSVKFNDSTIIRLIGYIRSKGFNAYFLSQPSELPFGHTREDLLIIHPEIEKP